MNAKLLRPLLALFLIATLVSCAGVSGNGTNGPIEASGTISAREADVAAELSGKVTEVLVNEGDTVAAGAPLFKLDDTVLSAQRDQAAAAVEAAKTTVEAARAQEEVANLQYQSALQGARLQDQPGRAAAWTASQPADFGLPAWYFERTEAISATQAEIQSAEDSLKIELANMSAVLASASNADVAAAEKRLAEAEATFLVARQTLSQTTGVADVEPVAREQYDAARTDMDAAQTDYDRILSTTATSDVLEARSRVAVSKARYDNALDRLSLLQTGEQSLQVQTAQAGLRLASSGVTQAEANLAQAEAALRILDVSLEKATVYAPIAGAVLTRQIEVGEMVAAGSTVMVIGQLDEVELTVYIGETQYGQVQLGRAATVIVDSFLGEEFAGTVFHIADQAEFTPRNVQTKAGRQSTVYAVDIRVPNADHKLKPGMPADVTIQP